MSVVGLHIAFRTDASLQIGTGHVMRCLTLADQLRSEGAKVAFICRDLPDGMFELLHARGYRSAKLPLVEAGKYLQTLDAEESIKASKLLFPKGMDWLVVDHYELDATWEHMLRPHARKCMVIDDLANRQHDCDLLLDQNYSNAREQCYAGLVPSTCNLLVGPRYALLRPEYAAYRKSQGLRNEECQTVLVFFGGSDQQNMTGFTLNVLTYPELRSLDVDVVIGANNPHRLTLEMQASERPRTRIHGPRPHLADLMAQSDLSIGAGGATTWERMCLGLPSIVISVADNQRSVSEGLAEAGLIEYIGDASEVRDIELAAAIKQLIENRNQRFAFAAQTQLLVDGLGTLRIADVLVTN